MFSYNYSIDSDFPNHWIDSDRFLKEIRESALPLFCGLTTVGDIATISFTTDLTPEQKTALDNLVKQHSGQPLPIESPTIKTDAIKNESGIPITSPTFFTSNYGWRMEGIRFVASGNAISMYDFKITKEVLIQGSKWWIKTNGVEDYADFSIVDKDNVLGIHTLKGLPIGYPIELKKFVKNYTIPPGINTGEIEAPTVSPVVSGLYIRTAYDNNGNEDAIIGVNYIWYEKD